MHPLHGKVALITGASSGIGRATALRLASFGVRVSVASRTVQALEEVVEQIKTLGVEALAVPTDVTDKEQCRRAVETTVTHFGQLDVLLCSAGVSLRGMFADTVPAALEHIMRGEFLRYPLSDLFRGASHQAYARFAGRRQQFDGQTRHAVLRHLWRQQVRRARSVR